MGNNLKFTSVVFCCLDTVLMKLKAFCKNAQLALVRSLGLGGVPNKPVQKLARIRICTLLAMKSFYTIGKVMRSGMRETVR